MPKFHVGDRVERVGTLVPTYMRNGVVTAVIPHDDLPEYLAEYDVDFKFVVARFYENQLKRADGAASANSSIWNALERNKGSDK